MLVLDDTPIIAPVHHDVASLDVAGDTTYVLGVKLSGVPYAEAFTGVPGCDGVVTFRRSGLWTPWIVDAAAILIKGTSCDDIADELPSKFGAPSCVSSVFPMNFHSPITSPLPLQFGKFLLDSNVNREGVSHQSACG